MKKPVLKIDKLSKSFGAIKANDNLNLNLFRNEIHALIGPNGSGKSTLVKQISGFLKQDSGQIYLEEIDISNYSAEHRSRMGIARSFQISSVINSFKVIDNLRLSLMGRDGGYLNPLNNIYRNKDYSDEAFDLLNIVDLTNKANDLVSTLSHGDKRKLEISLALSMNPKLFLFDEPMAGLDKISSKLMIDLFKKLKVKAPILLIEHDMESVFALADRISVLDYGSLIASGNEKEIKSNSKVQEVYLGDEN
ncbi:ABC transporter ATP-binding protein [Alphaproteobacteria bacterium]|nr:ABC transporter ATP-binding protein [Alphaproteobacteria bacterium]